MRSAMIRSLAPLGLCVVVLTSCGEELPTIPNVVGQSQRLRVVSGNGQRANLSGDFLRSVIVESLDSSGSPQAGARLRFVLLRGAADGSFGLVTGDDGRAVLDVRLLGTDAVVGFVQDEQGNQSSIALAPFSGQSVVGVACVIPSSNPAGLVRGSTQALSVFAYTDTVPLSFAGGLPTPSALSGVAVTLSVPQGRRSGVHGQVLTTAADGFASFNYDADTVLHRELILARPEDGEPCGFPLSTTGPFLTTLPGNAQLHPARQPFTLQVSGPPRAPVAFTTQGDAAIAPAASYFSNVAADPFNTSQRIATTVVTLSADPLARITVSSPGTAPLELVASLSTASQLSTFSGVWHGRTYDAEFGFHSGTHIATEWWLHLSQVSDRVSGFVTHQGLELGPRFLGHPTWALGPGVKDVYAIYEMPITGIATGRLTHLVKQPVLLPAGVDGGISFRLIQVAADTLLGEVNLITTIPATPNRAYQIKLVRQ